MIDPTIEAEAKHLLETNDTLLKEIERQHKFLLKKALAPIVCPSCGDTHTLVEAAIDPGWSWAGLQSYRCPSTETRMSHEITLFGGIDFFVCKHD